MIKSFKNKNLEKLMKRGVGVRLQQKHVPQLRRILTSLNDLRHPSDVRKIFGTQGHYLSVYKGKSDYWAIRVNGNWRVTFELAANGDVTNVDYWDYH